MSQSHEKLTGIRAEDVLADPTIPYFLIEPDDRPALVEAEAEAIRNTRMFDIEVRFRRVDGEQRWCRLISSPRAQPDGSLIWDGIQIDITENKRAEAALRQLNETLEERVAERTAELVKAQEALRQSQKLEAMGSLTGGVAHDFNNLLTPIVGSLDLLQRKGIGGEREQRMIEGALQSAERARVLVQRLLAFARRQPLLVEGVDLAALVREMAELIASTSGPRVKVGVEMADDLPPVRADRNQLELAVLNLAVNARDAMPDGGSLTVSASVDKVAGDHRSGLAEGRYVRLSVSDTGVGMDETVIKRAIEPFFSTKGVGKGTGLGLSMVHGLAAQLGGALALQSKRGLGTNVELWLPISEEAAERATSEDRLEPKGNLGRVLLVDDEELVRASTADMLIDMGYSVIEVSSGEDALEWLSGGEGADLVVTDHLMPGISGVDLARQVQKKWPKMPLMVISGYAEVEGIAPDLPRLTKPFRQSELANILARLELDAGRQSVN